MEPRPNQQRIHYFDHFRGLSILLIMIAHCFHPEDRSGELQAFLFNVVAGGTALFVFISGFFFAEVFARNFDYAAFMRKKAKQPLLPYLVMTALYLTLHVAWKGVLPMQQQPSGHVGLDWTLSLIGNVLLGGHLFAYWYVPFAMLLFAISPLVLQLMRLQTRDFVVMTVLMLIFAAVVHRPVMNLNPIHSLVYFLPFYLAGIAYSQRRQSIEIWLRGNTGLIAVLLVAVLAVMAWVGQTGSINKASMLTWAGFDWMVPRSVLIIALALSLLLRLGDRRLRTLEFLAASSFALFLLHPWFIELLAYTRAGESVPPDLVLAVRMVTVVGLSIISAITVKALLPRASQYLVGY